MQRCVTYVAGCSYLSGYSNAKHYFMADCGVVTEQNNLIQQFSKMHKNWFVEFDVRPSTTVTPLDGHGFTVVRSKPSDNYPTKLNGVYW